MMTTTLLHHQHIIHAQTGGGDRSTLFEDFGNGLEIENRIVTEHENVF